MPSTLPLWIIIGYLLVLIGLGVFSSRAFRGTSGDYFVASRSIGPFMLLMSIFGTTMTGFALVGSTAKSFSSGIGVYGMMASWSGLVHSAVFFLVGIRLWAIGKRYGYLTQVEFFRARFDSKGIGYLLFPILIILVIPYLLVGIISACKVIQPVTTGMFPNTFPGIPHPAKEGAMLFQGAVPPSITGFVICAVVLFYVFMGGVRSAVWANTFQTLVFMVMGVVAFWMISRALGGVSAATRSVLEHVPDRAVREGMVEKRQFFSYLFIPLSVGMFPHLFQHWLTARSAKSFRLTVIAHPIFIAIVWVPCVLVGIWAAAQQAQGVIHLPSPNAALATMVSVFVESDLLTGLLTAGILAAIMSSLDSQFVCLGTMFTNDIVLHAAGKKRFTDRQLLLIARLFVVGVVLLSYLLSMRLLTTNVFDLGVWCFSGFSGLFPLIFAAIYWKRTTRAGAYACILVTTAVWSYFFYQDILAPDQVPGEYLIAGFMPVAIIVLASAVTVVLVSLVTRPLPNSVVEKFFLSKTFPGNDS